MEGQGFTHLTTETIRRLCGTTNYVTGHTYYRAGRVGHLLREGSRASALVQGASFRSHRVGVEYTPGAPIKAECNCMRNSQWHEACKHIAAVLLAVIDQVQEKDSTEKIQRVIQNQIQQERRRDQNDAILRGIILHYFGDPHLKAEVERHEGGPALKVTIAPETEDGLGMIIIIPATRVPGFLEAVAGRENITFKGSAKNIQVSPDDAVLEADTEGTTLLRISDSVQKLSKEETARIKISRDWVFQDDTFHPIRRAPRLAQG